MTNTSNSTFIKIIASTLAAFAALATFAAVNNSSSSVVDETTAGHLRNLQLLKKKPPVKGADFAIVANKAILDPSPFVVFQTGKPGPFQAAAGADNLVVIGNKAILEPSPFSVLLGGPQPPFQAAAGADNKVVIGNKIVFKGSPFAFP